MATIVLGAQWGDEGKGKLVDILSPKIKLCARAQGGNNAGHTIVANGMTYDFHILPSGLLNPSCSNLVGSGCVVHIPGLLKELTDLEAKNLPNVRERLFISDRAHVVLDLHLRLDGLEESELGASCKIGTTGKGIGPCYSTKASRSGIRIAEVFQVELFKSKVRQLAAGFKKRFGDLLEYDPKEEIARFNTYHAELAPMVIDHLPLLMSVQQQKVPFLIEGANAIMLDIDAGTYPASLFHYMPPRQSLINAHSYITSSNTGLEGVLTSLGGLNPKNISSIVGVVKAFTTRVGAGPFPTEDLGEVGELFQVKGKEFGVTTGRKRRTGFLDLVVVRYSTAINSYSALNLTKLDILDTLPEIKVAVAYRDPQTKEKLEPFPADLELLAKVEVEYVTLKGWEKDITGAKSYYDLPVNCRKYCEFIEE